MAENITAVVVTPPRPIQPSLLGRVAVGAVLALGLHLALREWTLTLLAVAGGEQVLGFSAVLLLRWMALLPGGLLAGSGRHGAASTGAIVGAIVAGAWLVVDPYPHLNLSVEHLAFAGGLIGSGALLAYIGSRIWPPAADLPVPESPHQSSLLKMMSVNKPKATIPTQWARILLTATLILASIHMADQVRSSLNRMPTGMFQVNGSAAAKANFEITALLVMIFALASGASTRSGLRHGILTASLASVGAIFLYNSKPDGTYTGLEWLLAELKPEEQGVNPPLALGLILFVGITLAGTVGDQLFPKIKTRKRRRVDYA